MVCASTEVILRGMLIDMDFANRHITTYINNNINLQMMNFEKRASR